MALFLSQRLTGCRLAADFRAASAISTARSPSAAVTLGVDVPLIQPMRADQILHPEGLPHEKGGVL